jgi:hypothetical protein
MGQAKILVATVVTTVALCLVAVAPATGDPELRLASQRIVLGGVVYGAPTGAGWGAVRPHRLYNGGDLSGLIRDIQWSNWGGPEARGKGRHSIFRPGGGYYRQSVTILLRAKQVGTCEGRTAYLRLLVREPRRPGGALGPWRSWAGPQTICEPYGSSFSDRLRRRSDCINVNTRKITGIEITTSPGLGCPGARRVMKQYFRLVVDTGQTPGGCAQVRGTKGCQVGKFRCYTIYRYSTGELHGVCKGARGRVRFREFDRGPN